MPGLPANASRYFLSLEEHSGNVPEKEVDEKNCSLRFIFTGSLVYPITGAPEHPSGCGRGDQARPGCSRSTTGTLLPTLKSLQQHSLTRVQPTPGPSRTKSSQRMATSTSTSTLMASTHQTHPSAPQPHLRLLNPEILEAKKEVPYNSENEETDPRYTGDCERGLEVERCVDPEVIKEMETDERAIWLGKWFAHHYAPWVSEFNMKELETYTIPDADTLIRDDCVGPLPQLLWTFCRFRISDDEWRSPSFCSPVRYVLCLYAPSDDSHTPQVSARPQAFSLRSRINPSHARHPYFPYNRCPDYRRPLHEPANCCVRQGQCISLRTR